MYNPYSVGELVYLRHPTIEDVDGSWHEWLSDEELTRWLDERNFPNSKESQMEFYKAHSNFHLSNRLLLSIIEKEKDTHIGVCNLSSLNWVNRSCDIAIIIGNKDYQKGPYLTESFSILIRIAFLKLNLRIIKSFYSENNKSSVLMNRLFNFSKVGSIPKLVYDPKTGTYVDQIISILNRDDWIKVNGHNEIL